MADGSVVIEISGDDSEFKKSLAGLKSDSKKSAGELEQLGQSGKEAGSEIRKGMKDASSGMDDVKDSAGDGQQAIGKMGKESEGAKKSLKDMASGMLSSFKEISGSAGGLSEKIGSLGGMMKAAFAAGAVIEGIKAISGAFQTAIEKSTELQQSLNQLQASTGASAEQMKEYESVMESLWSNNFGESMDDLADAISAVKRNLGDMDASAMENVTAQAITLRDTFEYDIAESTKAAKAMMKNFGVSAEQAFNLIAAGAQNGLDYSGEMLDSISEYSVQFAKMGFSADEMFHILQTGADAGAFNLDKIGDAIKENAIRVIDLSDTSRGAFQSLGLNIKDMEKKFAAGGESANQAFEQVVTGLSLIKDPLKQNEIGVALFGTMWEDLGPQVVTQLANISDKAYASSDAMQQMMNVKYDDFNSALEGARRSMDVFFKNIGDQFAPQLTSAMGAVAQGIQSVTAGMKENGFTGALEAAHSTLQGFIGGIQENLPSMIASGGEMILQFITGSASFLPEILSIGASIVTSVIEGIAQMLPELPGIAADAIVSFLDGLTSGDSQMIGKGAELLLKVIEGIIKMIPELIVAAGRILAALGEALANGLSSMLEKGVELAKSVISGIANKLPEILAKGKEIVSNVASGIVDGIGAVRDGIVQVAEAIVSKLRSIIERVKEVGRNIIEGLWNGIQEKIDWVKGKIQDAVDGIKNVFTGIKGFFTGSPSRWSEDVGGWVMEGLGNGIEDNADIPIDAAGDAVQETKEVFLEGLQDAEREAEKIIKKDYKTIGQVQIDEMIKGLESKKEDSLTTFEKLVEDQFKAYKDKSGSLTGEYKTAADLLISEYKDALNEGYKEAETLVKERMTAIATEYQSQYDDIIKKRDSLQDALSSDFGDLFAFEDDTVQLENIDRSIEQIQQYNDLLTQLREEYGATDEFLAEITSLGADKGLMAAKKLVNLGQEEFGAYQTKWLEKQQLAQEVASAFYADQLNTLDSEFNQKLDEALADIPGELESIGKDSMQGWIDGMNSKLPDLEAKARSIANRVISAMRDAMDIHSPSKKSAKLVGVPTAQGIGVGFERAFPQVMSKLRGTVDVEMARTSARLTGAANRGGINGTVREITNNNTTVERTVGVEATESLAELIRLLRLEIIKEDKRVGKSMVTA